jgi:hypothetical protein
MLRTFLATMLFTMNAQAGNVGFVHGSEFTAAAVEGRVTVHCNGTNGVGNAVYNCRDAVLEPQLYDYFMGPQDARATDVELKCARDDGSVRSKTSGYDGNKGISTDSFNLWILTLFQKPLLQVGLNTIDYRITADDRAKTEISKGRFVVNVVRTPARRCPDAHYTSTDINDCNAQYSVCQKYFEEYHNCH